MRNFVLVRFQVFSVFAGIESRQCLGADRWIAVGVKIAKRPSEAHVYVGELSRKVLFQEQKLFLDATRPPADAAQDEWDEFHSLVERLR